LETWCLRAPARLETSEHGAFCCDYREPLVRAAIAITGSDTLGRELADQLYAELFG